jgi:hypothetical protein
MKVGINSGKRKNNMKLTVAIISILTTSVLFAGALWAEQYREGKVYVTRTGSPQPALERSSMGTSRDDERIIDAKDPVVVKRAQEQAAEESRVRRDRENRTAVVRREEESEERIDRRTVNFIPAATRDSENSSRTSPRRTKVDFIDKDKDGYDDRRNVSDM